MHLVHAQSLSSGQEIKRPYIYEKYFHLPFDKYIVIGPYSKGAKNYDLYADVLHIILPTFNEHGIKIVQIGAQGERPLVGAYNIAGQTNINQIAYIIKNSLLFFGADSFGQHLAGIYNIPLVDLISNNYVDVVRPYFGDRERQIIIESPKNKGEKPSFAFEENPKLINKIPPEQIAKSILRLLNLEYNWPYKQIYLGDIYIAPMIINVCDGVLNPQQFGTDAMIMDMTLNFNEQVLIQQMQICPCSILTNKPLSNSLLEFHKQTKRIREIVYIIEQDHSPEFIKKLFKYHVPFRMVSELSEQEIRNIKLDYMEIGVIHKKPIFHPKNIIEFEKYNLDNLYFKSGRFYIGRKKIYPSRKHYLDDKNVNAFEQVASVINHDDFWKELDSFRILDKIA